MPVAVLDSPHCENALCSNSPGFSLLELAPAPAGVWRTEPFIPPRCRLSSPGEQTGQEPPFAPHLVQSCPSKVCKPPEPGESSPWHGMCSCKESSRGKSSAQRLERAPRRAERNVVFYPHPSCKYSAAGERFLKCFLGYKVRI